ncbi:MAG TPA: hypothetical protein VF928_15370 [Usitatibacteraceae bacterium]
MNPGRACPLHYRYSPAVFGRDADLEAETLYIVGGLYGNRAALATILQMASREPVAPTLVFNGDFNWFDTADADFRAINEEVLQHIALRGNVETELAAPDGNDSDDAGCGCAYPDEVGDAEVERSNQIMRRLRATGARHPELRAQLTALPMHAVASVGGVRIGIVHGDAESLAGWRFAHNALDEETNRQWLVDICRHARLAGFASSHTCLPTLRRQHSGAGRSFIANNGAAGMPNFAYTGYGLITRISRHAAAEGLAQYGIAEAGLFIDALPVHYDARAFRENFIANWPPGSPAHQSYFARICNGPAFASPQALGLVKSSAFACV